MDNRIYSVTGFDEDTQEEFAFTDRTIEEAKELYNTLFAQEGIIGMVILEFNRIEKVFNVVEI